MKPPREGAETPAPATVLLVDDDRVFSRALGKKIRGWGHAFASAPSGEEGLKRLLEGGVNLVLLDLVLPGMSGLALLSVVRGNERTRGIPVLVLSGRSERTALATSLEAGADDFLLKPFQDEELRARIALHLERAATLRRVSEAEARWRVLFENASEAMCTLDRRGHVTAVNQKLLDLLGYGAEEMVGRPYNQFLAPDSVARAREIFRSFLRGETVDRFELELVRRGGSPVRMETVAAPLPGEAAGVLALRDVTMERRLQEEIRTAQEFRDRIIQSSPDAVVASDMKGNLLLFNRRAEQIFGYRAEEVLGRLHVRALYPAGGAEDIMQRLRSPDWGGAGKLLDYPSQIVTRTGEVIPIRISAALVYEGGHEAASVGFFTDMRDRIRMERDLRIANQKLIEKEKEAALVEMAGVTAHEVNQPLTAILAASEMLAKRTDTPEGGRKLLDLIVREAERLAQIVRQLGHITRYETRSYAEGTSKIIDLARASEKKP